MTSLTAFQSSTELLAARAQWAIALLDELVQRGRRDGWLDGPERAPHQPAGELAAAIAQRVSDMPLAHAPMHLLEARLGLSVQQLDALWLLACIELSPRVARFAEVFATTGCTTISLQILLELVPLTAGQLAALEHMHLIELPDDRRTPRHRRPIRVCERVVELARGEIELDRELRTIARLEPATGSPPDPVSNPIAAQPPSLLVVTGPSDLDPAAFAVRCAHQGALCLAAHELSLDAGEFARQLRVIWREASLFGLTPLFDGLSLDPERLHIFDRELASYPGPLLATAPRPIRIRSRPVTVHRLEPPPLDDRRALWRSALPEAADAAIDDAAARFALGASAIASVARNARACAQATEPLDVRAIVTGASVHFADRIGDQAARVKTRQTWDDLVMSRDQLRQVVELVARIRHHKQVFDTWGFADKVGRGIGTVGLLSGPPGTGKTMIAGLIANEVGLELYQVDLSKIVSKYIGETEKSLAALFDAAEAGHAMLLFDEADSLFAKRTEVKSANDRYANLEVNYLLQRLEAFTGVALLTTNHETAIDDAFRRRLAVHLRFEVPDERERARLWRAVIPSRAKIAGAIDHERLAAEFAMSGGYIKNAAVRAAFFAAADGVPISHAHLAAAARLEYEALGRVLHRN